MFAASQHSFKLMLCYANNGWPLHRTSNWRFRKPFIAQALVRNKIFTTPQIIKLFHISGKKPFVFLMFLFFLLFFAGPFFLVLDILKQFVIHIGHKTLWHQMTLCLITPRTSKVIGICVWNAWYRYSSETMRDRDLKRLPMSLVYLEAPSIYHTEKRQMSPSSSNCPWMILKFLKNTTFQL